MIFAIQRSLEDYFNRCGCEDPDQYAVRLAELFDRSRAGTSSKQFLTQMKRIRTAFYRTNGQVRRDPFERKILTFLDSQLKKKDQSSSRARLQKGLRHLALA